MRSRSSGGMPGPVVGDRDRRPRPVARVRLHAHRRAARAVAQRVVEQDPHHAGDRVGIAAAPARPAGQHDVDRRSARSRARSSNSAATARTISPSSTGSERSGTAASRRERSSSSPASAESRLSSVRASATWRRRVGARRAGPRAGPPRAAPSCPGASSAACAARARRSRRTRAARPPGGAAPPACGRARARGRRPRRGASSCGVGASGPSSVIRSAAARRRREPAQQRGGEGDARAARRPRGRPPRRSGSGRAPGSTSAATSVSSRSATSDAGELAADRQRGGRRRPCRRRCASGTSAAAHARRAPGRPRAPARRVVGVVEEAEAGLARRGVGRLPVSSITSTRAFAAAVELARPRRTERVVAARQSCSVSASEHATSKSRPRLDAPPSSRVSTLWSRRRSCIGGSTTSAATPSVTALVASSASSSRQRRPAGSAPPHDSRKR